LERVSIITHNTREEKYIVKVTWKPKGQVYCTISNNLVRQAMVLAPYNQLNQIELRNERKDLMARALTTGSLATVWQDIYVGMQGTFLALSAWNGQLYIDKIDCSVKR
jgi:hypothetical protein